MVPDSKIQRVGIASAAALAVSMVVAACGGSTASQAVATAAVVAPTKEAPAAVGSPPAAASGAASPSATTAAEATPSVAPDACQTLVTKDEVEAAIDGTVGKLELNGKSDAIVGIPPYGGSLCWYPITNGVFVQVTIGQAPDTASLASALATYKAKNPGQDVSGLGDAAYSSDNGLMVIDGARLVCITIYSSDMDSAASQAAQVALAKKVLERW